MNDDFILKKLLDDSKKQEISFLRIGNIDKEDYELFKDFIKTKFSSFLIDFRDEVKDIDLNRKNIIFCEIGQVRKKEIDKLKNYLDLFQLNLLELLLSKKILNLDL